MSQDHNSAAAVSSATESMYLSGKALRRWRTHRSIGLESFVRPLHEMNLVMLTDNELKAMLAFARGRHRQRVRARWVPLRYSQQVADANTSAVGAEDPPEHVVTRWVSTQASSFCPAAPKRRCSRLGVVTR